MYVHVHPEYVISRCASTRTHTFWRVKTETCFPRPPSKGDPDELERVRIADPKESSLTVVFGSPKP